MDSSIRIALWVRRAQVRRTAHNCAKVVPEGLRTARFESLDSAMGYRGAHASRGVKVWGSLALFVENVHKIASIEHQMKRYRTSRSTSRTSFVGGDCATPLGLTGLGSPPIMRRSFENSARKGDYVVYVSTAVEPQKEARTRFPQAHEHKKRPQSVGPPSGQGPRAFDGLDTRAARASAPLVFLKQGRFPRTSRSGPSQLGMQESGGRL